MYVEYKHFYDQREENTSDNLVRVIQTKIYKTNGPNQEKPAPTQPRSVSKLLIFFLKKGNSKVANPPQVCVSCSS